MGRSVSVHLLVALQRPDAAVLGGAIRDQFGLRIALGWLSPDGYRMIFGNGYLISPTRVGEGWGLGHRDAGSAVRPLSGAAPRPIIVLGRPPGGL